MSNVKTVFEKLNRFVFTIFLLFTHRCETQEVEVKNTQPNFVATKFFLFYTNKGIIHLIPVTLLCVYYHIRVHIYIYMWNISHVRIVVRNWIPKRFFSETWSILLKNLSKFFLSSQKWMLARKNSCHKNEAFQKWLTSLGAHLFSFGAKGKSTIPFNRQTAKG